jgi:hypothetical protein
MAGVTRHRGRFVLFLLAVSLTMYVPVVWRCRAAPPEPSACPVTRSFGTVSISTPSSAPPCESVTAAAIVHQNRPSRSALTTPQQRSPVGGAYHMRIVVFTYRRLAGLKRLLTSLSSAWYMGHDVSLTIFLDFPKKGSSVRDDDGTRKFVSSYKWPHGRLTVHRRLANAGLKKTIMESWYPSADSDEVTAFFEDDIEVSPLWYSWAMAALAKYANKNSPQPEGLLGISLFRPIHDELSGRSCKLGSDTPVFALQQPCSWGAVFLPGPWRAFRDWYDDFTSKGDQDALVALSDGSEPTSNTWDRHSSWKKYLIKVMVERGWYMVYPNPPDQTVLSTNHLMKGEHPLPNRKLFELPLLNPSSPSAMTFLGGAVSEGNALAAFDRLLPPLAAMKAFDVMFRSVDGLSNLPRS